MFCSQCGAKLDDTVLFCAGCGAKMGAGQAVSSSGTTYSGTVSEKENVLRRIEAELAKHPQLVFNRSNQTDLEIKSVLADASWGVGKKKVEYSACLLAKEDEHKVLYWEIIKESGSGMEPFGGFKMEGFQSGKQLFGKKKEIVIGPDGKKIVDYEWDYAATRKIVEDVARACGWQFKVVLMKKNASY